MRCSRAVRLTRIRSGSLDAPRPCTAQVSRVSRATRSSGHGFHFVGATLLARHEYGPCMACPRHQMIVVSTLLHLPLHYAPLSTSPDSSPLQSSTEPCCTFTAGEISFTGPMFGHGMASTAGRPSEIEVCFSPPAHICTCAYSLDGSCHTRPALLAGKLVETTCSGYQTSTSETLDTVW